MNFARLSKSTADIPAAKAIHGRRYICPSCHEPVFLRKGRVNRAHFAHVSGRADESCENYFPSDRIGSPLGQFDVPTRDASTVIRPAYLAVRLSSGQSKIDAKKWTWHFGAVLPKAELPLGKFKLETGFGGYKEIPLSALRSGESFVEINPLGGVGVRWISPEVPEAYRVAIVEPIRTMAGQTAYVFAGAGRLKRRHQTLNWGCLYLLARYGEIRPTPPILDMLPLASNNGWSATMVTLPSDPDETVATWIEDFFGLKIAPLSRQWGILHPPPIERDADGDILTGPSATVFVGFRDEEEQSSNLSLTTSSGATPHEISLVPKCVVPIEMPEGREKSSLQISWGGRYLDRIRQECRQVEEISIDIMFKEDHGVFTHPLHRQACRNALESVRFGRAEIIGMSLPAYASGFLRVARASTSFATALEFTARNYRQEVIPKAIAILQEAMTDLNTDIDLEFGAFGRFYALSNLRIVQEAQSRYLTKQQRQEALYVLRIGDARSGANLARASDGQLRERAAKLSFRSSRHRLLASLLGVRGSDV